MTLTQNLQNIHPTKRTFADLQIGDTFDFVNMSQPMMNSFYRRCEKISPRKYQSIDEPKTVYRVGSATARVYHVADTIHNTPEAIARLKHNHDSHYIAGSGEHGCLYDSCSVHRTLKSAVDSLAETFQLSRTRKANLRKYRHLDLNPSRDGASYCEIQTCNCAEPWIHDDDGTPEDWE